MSCQLPGCGGTASVWGRRHRWLRLFNMPWGLESVPVMGLSPGKRPGVSLPRSRTPSFTSTERPRWSGTPGLRRKDHDRQRPLPLQCPVRLCHLTPFLIRQRCICSAQPRRGVRALCSPPPELAEKSLFSAGGTGAAQPPFWNRSAGVHEGTQWPGGGGISRLGGRSCVLWGHGHHAGNRGPRRSTPSVYRS